jgi:hypothetical protein
MRNFRTEIVLTSLIVVVFGLFCTIVVPSVYTVPEMPETGLKDEPCTLSEAIAGCEMVIEKNREYLDELLARAEAEAKITVESDVEIVRAEEPAYMIRKESETEVETGDEPEHFIPDIEIIRALEPTVEETETEIEISEEESVLISETPVEVEITQPASTFTPVASMMNPDLQRWTYDYCTSQGIDPYIIMAICERESCCIANIYGDNGKAYGMMQIQVRWVQDRLRAHGLTNEDLMYAQNNIMIGSEIYRDYVNEGQGVRYALMKYNGGPGLVGTPSTQEYADWVINRANELRGYSL